MILVNCPFCGVLIGFPLDPSTEEVKYEAARSLNRGGVVCVTYNPKYTIVHHCAAPANVEKTS